jgi:ABC-type iron transport system FetAB ATPase subunit
MRIAVEQLQLMPKVLFLRMARATKQRRQISSAVHRFPETANRSILFVLRNSGTENHSHFSWNLLLCRRQHRFLQ